MKVLSLSFLCSICLFKQHLCSKSWTHQFSSVNWFIKWSQGCFYYFETIRRFLDKNRGRNAGKIPGKSTQLPTKYQCRKLYCGTKKSGWIWSANRTTSLKYLPRICTKLFRKRRQELIQPILDKINKAIQDVEKKKATHLFSILQWAFFISIRQMIFSPKSWRNWAIDSIFSFF